MRRRLDAAFVEYAKSPERGQAVYWDQKLPGFGLRVSCGGGKTWVYAYRHAGKMKWMKLGSYPGTSLADARAAAHIAAAKHSAARIRRARRQQRERLTRRIA